MLIRLRWRRTLAMNFGPAPIAFAAALALAPLMARLGLPRYFSMTAAEALVLIPIELELLLRAAHRATGVRHAVLLGTGTGSMTWACSKRSG